MPYEANWYFACSHMITSSNSDGIALVGCHYMLTVRDIVYQMQTEVIQQWIWNSGKEIEPHDIQLVKFVEQNGKDVTLPYEVKLTGVRIGNDRFSAVIAYDKNGVAKSVAVQVWTPEGRPDGWSTENNPGDLGEIIW